MARTSIGSFSVFRSRRFPQIVGEIVAKDNKWKEMFQGVHTISNAGFSALAYQEPSLTPDVRRIQAPSSETYVEPLDTWSDMTHLLKSEKWDQPMVPQQLAYICGVLQDARPISDSLQPRSSPANRMIGSSPR